MAAPIVKLPMTCHGWTFCLERAGLGLEVTQKIAHRWNLKFFFFVPGSCVHLLK